MSDEDCSKLRFGFWFKLTAVIFALVVLFVHDLLSGPRGPNLWMVLIRALPLVLVLAVCSLFIFAIALTPGLLRDTDIRKSKRRKGLLTGLAGVLCLPLLLLTVEDLVYDPLKFSYLIYRIEYADTRASERRSFALANRWGFVWEVHPVKRALTGRYRNQSIEDLWKIEWLECWPSGEPYRAYRTIIDEGNVNELER